MVALSRVQSPDVSVSIREYLRAVPPSVVKVVPLVLPTLDVPFKDYVMLQLNGTATGAGSFHTSAVPVGYDFMIYNGYFTIVGGNKITGVYVVYPKGKVAGTTGSADIPIVDLFWCRCYFGWCLW